ncbi:MAG: KR domain-containing protein [Actinobacteria bacterium]|nr:MAG: KR domain-containing protein [Actinomycetota bacterium]
MGEDGRATFTTSMRTGVRILVAGGYGVFGRLLAAELLETTDARLVLAGRNRRQAERAAAELGSERTEAIELDLRDVESVARAAEGCFAIACAAGPFQGLARDLPLAAIRSGAHWLDIADDPGWVLSALGDEDLGEASANAGLVVAPGLSTVPAVSGVLARWCVERLDDPHDAHVTLFIGNRNRKGAGATASALIAGFRDPSPVDLPFGRRVAYRFPTPDTELFRRDLGIRAEFRVALEWGSLGRMAAALGRATAGIGTEGQIRLARALSTLSEPFARFGTELGCVQVELHNEAGSIAATALAGQRLVVLPCALAVRALLSGELDEAGSLHPAAWLPHDEYIARLRSRRVRFLARERRGSRSAGSPP